MFICKGVTFVLFTSYFPIPRIIRNPTNLDVE
jgi:hypothetical protein